MKACLNPDCRKKFKPGHYGDRQRICGDPKCLKWYKSYWSRMKKVPRGIADAVWKRIVEAAKPDALRHAFLVVARESGLRKGELLGLTWGDIVGPDGAIRSTFGLRGQWDETVGFKTPKKGSERTAFLLDGAQKVLAGLKRGGRDDRVFEFSESGIYKWFVALQERLAIKSPETGKPYRLHDIRHSVGVEFVRQRKRPDLAQKILGHRDIKTTMGYAELRDDELAQQMKDARKEGR